MTAGTVPPVRPGSAPVFALVVRWSLRDRRREDRRAVRRERDGHHRPGNVECTEGEVVSAEAGHRGDEGVEVEDRGAPLGGQTELGRERLRGRSSALLEASDGVVGREESDEFDRCRTVRSSLPRSTWRTRTGSSPSASRGAARASLPGSPARLLRRSARASAAAGAS